MNEWGWMILITMIFFYIGNREDEVEEMRNDVADIKRKLEEEKE